MPASPWLTLIVPGIAASLAQCAQQGNSSRELARVAGRGSLACKWDRRGNEDADLLPWQRGLLAALNLSSDDFASAPITAYGSDRARSGEFWLQVEPVHLAAGLDHLTLLPLQGQAAVEPQERDALFEVLAGHLQAGDATLCRLIDASWSLHCGQQLDVETVCPPAAAARELERAMPRGRGAGTLRRWMTEWQMLLHEHPVNNRRLQRGLPAINAVWPWGAGRLGDRIAARRLPEAFGGDLYLHGIYALHGQEVSRLPGAVEELVDEVQGMARAVCVNQAADLNEWQERWLVPALKALSARRLARLDLILDGWYLPLDRAVLRRFWRKPLPPAEWLA